LSISRIRSPSVTTYFAELRASPATVSIGGGRRLIQYMGLNNAIRSGCSVRGAGWNRMSR
jgi:hypothetical protein